MRALVAAAVLGFFLLIARLVFGAVPELPKRERPNSVSKEINWVGDDTDEQMAAAEKELTDRLTNEGCLGGTVFAVGNPETKTITLVAICQQWPETETPK